VSIQQRKTSRDPCFDFFHIVPSIKSTTVVVELLDMAWPRNP
jgi:hypothetical protein